MYYIMDLQYVYVYVYNVLYNGSPIYSPETEREADSQLALSTEQGRTQVGKV